MPHEDDNANGRRRPASTLADPAVGLCASCRSCRRITSKRGSTFLMCALAAVDERYARYPRLPVLACPGWQADS